MKLVTILSALLLSQSLHSQQQLDPTRAAVFSSQLSPAQLKRADSVLQTAINYYNHRVARRSGLVHISDSDHAEFERLDSMRKIYNAVLQKSGEMNKRKLSKLSPSEQNKAAYYSRNKTATDSALESLIKKDSAIRLEDSFMLSWGVAEYIELSKYYRQYDVLAVNDTIINAGCICEDIVSNLKITGIDWKKHILRINDGGNCFFRIRIFLTSGKFDRMRVNGM